MPTAQGCLPHRMQPALRLVPPQSHRTARLGTAPCQYQGATASVLRQVQHNKAGRCDARLARNVRGEEDEAPCADADGHKRGAGGPCAAAPQPQPGHADGRRAAGQATGRGLPTKSGVRAAPSTARSSWFLLPSAAKNAWLGIRLVKGASSGTSDGAPRHEHDGRRLREGAAYEATQKAIGLGSVVVGKVAREHHHVGSGHLWGGAGRLRWRGAGALAGDRRFERKRFWLTEYLYYNITNLPKISIQNRRSNYTALLLMLPISCLCACCLQHPPQRGRGLIAAPSLVPHVVHRFLVRVHVRVREVKHRQLHGAIAVNNY